MSDNAVALWAELDMSGINEDLKSFGDDFNVDLLGVRNFGIDITTDGEISSEEPGEAKQAPEIICPSCSYRFGV